jgi:hypothetical protein
MKSGDYDHVRLILRGRAAGGITQRDVQRRARELSLLRTGSEDYTAEDIEDAERELMLGHDPATMTDDEPTFASATRDPSDPLATQGEMYDTVATADENADPERLAVQGVEEAQHDQMVEARKASLQSHHPSGGKLSHQAGHKAPRKRKPSDS